MTAKQHMFHLVATIPGAVLADVLAVLQIGGADVETCTVIVPMAPPTKPAPATKPRPGVHSKRLNLKSAIQTGVSQRTRELLDAYDEGDEVTSTHIVNALVAEGFKRASASSVVSVGLLGPRFQVIVPGRYKVVDRNQPLTLYRPTKETTHG